MKISKATVAEAHITVRLDATDLLALLPAKYRKMVEGGATFFPSVKVGENDPAEIKDGNIILSVWQRGTPKEAEVKA